MSKTQDIVIRIDAVGTVHGLHYDNFDLGFLGPKQIERASEILFDDDSQTFYVLLPGFTVPTGHSLRGFPKYDMARSFEVFLLENAAYNRVTIEDEASFWKFANNCRHRWDYSQRGLFVWEDS